MELWIENNSMVFRLECLLNFTLLSYKVRLQREKSPGTAIYHKIVSKNRKQRNNKTYPGYCISEADPHIPCSHLCAAFCRGRSLGPDQAPKEWKPSNRVQKIVDKNLKDDSTLKEEAGRLSKGKTRQGEGWWVFFVGNLLIASCLHRGSILPKELYDTRSSNGTFNKVGRPNNFRTADPTQGLHSRIRSHPWCHLLSGLCSQSLRQRHEMGIWWL